MTGYILEQPKRIRISQVENLITVEEPGRALIKLTFPDALAYISSLDRNDVKWIREYINLEPGECLSFELAVSATLDNESLEERADTSTLDII